MRNYELRAQDFIKAIFPYIVNANNDLYRISIGIDAYNTNFNRKVRMCHGIARVALIASDYVVKFDYNKEECAQYGGCKDEYEFYNLAESEGFGYLFAKTSKFSYKGHDFYIMPRINGIGKECNYFREADEFMTYEEVHWCISHKLADLHYKNYGFRNGKVCIIDYACQLNKVHSSSDTSSFSFSVRTPDFLSNEVS